MLSVLTGEVAPTLPYSWDLEGALNAQQNVETPHKAGGGFML
jgi:hypothetical protein